MSAAAFERQLMRDHWNKQLQLESAFGVRVPLVSHADWSDSWLPTNQMRGGRRLL